MRGCCSDGLWGNERFLLTQRKGFCMLLMEKRYVGKKPFIFSKPQKFALQKGTGCQRSQSPACGAFLFPSDSISFSWLPLTIDHPLSFSTCTLIGAWFRQRQIYKLIQLSNGASPIPPCNYNRGVRGESKDRLRNADGSKRTSRNSKQNW